MMSHGIFRFEWFCGIKNPQNKQNFHEAFVTVPLLCCLCVFVGFVAEQCTYVLFDVIYNIYVVVSWFICCLFCSFMTVSCCVLLSCLVSL